MECSAPPVAGVGRAVADMVFSLCEAWVGVCPITVFASPAIEFLPGGPGAGSAREQQRVDEIWQAVRWLHVLAMAFFVGGPLLLAVAVVPVERSAPDRERLRPIARRFGYGTLLAIAVLLPSGSAMASHF